MSEFKGENIQENVFEGYEGYGTEELSGGVPFLSIVQKVTKEGQEQGKEIGCWWHTGLSQSFGETVNVIPMGWKEIYVEKGENGRTVAYHKPDEVVVKDIGQGATYKCINPETGNKIDRTFFVPVLIQMDGIENSLAILIPNIKSNEAMRAWRKQLNFNRLGNGAKAPIFSHVWELTLAPQKNKGNEYYVISVVKKGQRIPDQLFLNVVKPTLQLTADPWTLLPAVRTQQEEEEFANVSDGEGIM